MRLLPDSARAGELRIASYNIHRCVGADGRCNANRIIEVIRELHCDTIGLQEVDNVQSTQPQSMQMDFIASVTGMTAVAGLRIVRRQGEYGNPSHGCDGACAELGRCGHHSGDSETGDPQTRAPEHAGFGFGNRRRSHCCRRYRHVF